MKILIINSKEHWINGWMSFPSSLETVVNTLQKTTCQIDTTEVQSLQELNLLLQKTEPDTLVWANAYLVNGTTPEHHNLVQQIEHYNLPMLGSDASTLLKLLEKDSCQKILKQSGIPVPKHYILSTKKHDWLSNNRLTFPLIVKPTNESRSNGVTKVNNAQEAMARIETLQTKYPNSKIIIEEFLPTKDITCGFLKLGDEIMLLPSYNIITDMDPSTEIFSEAHYKLPPSCKNEVLIQDKNILSQLEHYVPLIVELLGIRNFTRVDGRLDANGILKFFDINGMPGLNYPNSAIIKQCCIHFPNYSEAYLFECLLNTIILENLFHYQLPVPQRMQEHHLFNLESDTIIRLKSPIKVEEYYSF